MLILITGVLNLTFFSLKHCFSCTENLDSVPRITISTFTGFCAVLVCWRFLCIHRSRLWAFQFYLKSFFSGRRVTIGCLSGSGDTLKTVNYGGSLSLSHCAFVLLSLWKKRKLFWNKLDTVITENMNSCLKLACLWWVFKSPVLISTAPTSRILYKVFLLLTPSSWFL